MEQEIKLLSEEVRNLNANVRTVQNEQCFLQQIQSSPAVFVQPQSSKYDDRRLLTKREVDDIVGRSLFFITFKVQFSSTQDKPKLDVTTASSRCFGDLPEFFDSDTCVYTTPVAGRYRFHLELKSASDVHTNWALCWSDAAGVENRRELFYSSKGNNHVTEHQFAGLECGKGYRVWIEPELAKETEGPVVVGGQLTGELQE